MAEHFDRAAVRRGFSHPAGSPALQAALAQTAARSREARAQVFWPALRDAAHRIKAFSIAHLDTLLEEFERQFSARGGVVLWAATAHEAVQHVVDICRSEGARFVVKGKSMLSEEIELNARLAQSGIEAVETDLGEFIVALAGQRPSHIVGPALHLSRSEIGELFRQKLGVAYTDDPEALMAAARAHLRERYLQAKVGITGVNFAVAQTGTLVVVENEGNTALCASLPRVHIALMGMEKVIPRLEDLQVFLRLLARAATGQQLTSYTHYFLGAETNKRLYCIIVDAKRSALLADPRTRQSLFCIRCGACLNACPVYRRAGGWAYGGTYSGPIGAAVTPTLLGDAQARELPFASSLCGACEDACPVRIDLAHQLVYLRHRIFEKDALRQRGDRLVDLWAKAMRDVRRYRRGVRLLQRVLRVFSTTRLKVGPLGSWMQKRGLPAVPAQSFKEWWERRR